MLTIPPYLGGSQGAPPSGQKAMWDGDKVILFTGFVPHRPGDKVEANLPQMYGQICQTTQSYGENQ